MTDGEVVVLFGVRSCPGRLDVCLRIDLQAVLGRVCRIDQDCRVPPAGEGVLDYGDSRCVT